MVASNEVKSPESASAAMIAKKRKDFFSVARWVASSRSLWLCFSAIVFLEETSPVTLGVILCSGSAVDLVVSIAWALFVVTFCAELAAIVRER